MKIVRWGIIGCGDVTEVKSGPAFRLANGSALVAVMRRDAGKAADYAKRHGVPRWYNDADRLIHDPEVDAVYVATPPGSHEQYALRACAAGKPCYVEKPMSRNAAEARRMVAAFVAAKLPLFVAYYRRRLPRFVKAKEILDAGELGTLRSISYRLANGDMRAVTAPLPWRLQPEHAGAGLFADLGSHALDLLDWFVGPLRNVRGHADNRGNQTDVEDHVQLYFQSDSGIDGSAEWDFTSETRDDTFHLIGEKASLRFSCFGQEPVLLQYADGREQRFDLPHPPHVQQPLIQSIVDCLRNQTPPSVGTAAAALRTQEVMDIALTDYYGGREDGFWNRRR